MINIQLNPVLTDPDNGSYDAAVTAALLPGSIVDEATLDKIPGGKISYALQLGDAFMLSPSRTMSDGNPLRNGGSFQVNLRFDESFQLEDAVFAGLVNNYKNGGGGDFLSRVLHLMDLAPVPILTLDDDGTPMSSADVLNFTV